MGLRQPSGRGTDIRELRAPEFLEGGGFQRGIGGFTIRSGANFKVLNVDERPASERWTLTRKLFLLLLAIFPRASAIIVTLIVEQRAYAILEAPDRAKLLVDSFTIRAQTRRDRRLRCGRRVGGYTDRPLCRTIEKL